MKYHAFSAGPTHAWHELGDFSSATTATAVARELNKHAFVLTDHDIRDIAEGRSTIYALEPRDRIELAIRCAHHLGDAKLEAGWTRALGVILPGPRNGVERVRKSPKGTSATPK